MINRLFGVLYILAALWAGLVWLVAGNLDGGEQFHLLVMLMFGLPPLCVVTLIHYIAFGRL